MGSSCTIERNQQLSCIKLRNTEGVFTGSELAWSQGSWSNFILRLHDKCSTELARIRDDLNLRDV